VSGPRDTHGRVSIRAVAVAVAKRSIHNSFTNPAVLLPSMIFPLIFLIAFAGGLSRISGVPGFDYPPGYTTFQFVFVLLQASAFGGIFTGFAIALDWESGFARRLMLTAPRREGIVIGYVIGGLARWVATGGFITVAALIGGMNVDGGAVDLAAVAGLAGLVNVTATLFSCGLAMRARSLQIAPAMQIPVFLILFLAPVYVPLGLLTGWIHAVASYNPATLLLEAGRALLAGAPEHVAAAFAAVAGLIALFVVWALRGLRRAEAAA
jgi:ABC-type multidrug transport system permease subunit